MPFAPPRLLGGTVPCPQAGVGAAETLLNIFIPAVSACPGAANGPLAAFTYDSCFCLTVLGFQMNFNANWSASTTGTIVLYTWNFGDGTPQVQTTSPSITYNYRSLGPNNAGWRATLTVKDSSGLTGNVTETVTPDAIPRFIFQPLSPSTGQQVTFNGSASQVYGNSNTTGAYNWSFGDGTNASGAVVNHTFSIDGLYRVTLAFHNVYGTSLVSKTVLVAPDPPANSGGGGGGGRRAVPT